MIKNAKFRFTLFFAMTVGFFSNGPFLYSVTDAQIDERVQYEKRIRTRMPPQIAIEMVQKEFENMSVKWKTFWQVFVVEDDPKKEEFVIIARSIEKKWAFALLKEDCPKPINFEQLNLDAQGDGTPVRMDVMIGIKKEKSWFRHIITVYEPMYEHWKNPCYEWNLPSGKSKDKFYNENYTMKVYSKNLGQNVYELVKSFGDWRPPREVKKISAMRGRGQELIGGESELLTEEERMLPVEQQEKILKQRVKEDIKREKQEEKKRKKSKK